MAVHYQVAEGLAEAVYAEDSFNNQKPAQKGQERTPNLGGAYTSGHLGHCGLRVTAPQDEGIGIAAAAFDSSGMAEAPNEDGTCAISQSESKASPQDAGAVVVENTSGRNDAEDGDKDHKPGDG